MDIKYTINDLDEIADLLLEKSNSRILLFHGEMGVGKTTLIKTLVSKLGSSDEVQSPTYSLVNEYKTKDASIYHFDLYRVNDSEELYNFGFEEYLFENHWVFIEWPEIASEFLTDGVTEIHLELEENNSRKINIINT
ncbi:tRNA (adenosine(37)-N6)-threonylcarbamoyltransferase complex ATPase subunit type 1 TsaE [Oceanihabitans sediminis]|uniref:tRNA threonylcarbamoyladenosine biosynthesis protein TsaE n=1 Tax=Oceanihabitans sediminis TaxID=1812012 RepID=A0A368P566_9FLAO|nr:tRNA (adenosine(37)-N6)-threonylcarbamoyltransferase complex ATPase subunit type 1 TsaE [Oceanihabitans sediminis]MDX1277205.1 tRNA (adenosine(37)-N6)-threonylcarbamoyltransferase complex ATPase subunit type 1 TsaE [Oceanihabitans sediminis]RBP33067.1 tRNA threonylcarbamoyladenosine biosynthesis protein TsaE [Oceanihabitans sediminis]RCU57420.1 tRNA (adenosine(37)-N6)-threonylcarbamoyltransferase complex ATPase subunit type 1 TsaE [Oceanihabitans sediminis]